MSGLLYVPLYIVGGSLGVAVAELLRRRMNLARGQLIQLAAFLFLSGVVGSGVYGYVIQSFGLSGIAPTGTSMTGAIALTVPALWLFSKVAGIPAAKAYDLSAVCAPLGFAVGRFG